MICVASLSNLCGCKENKYKMQALILSINPKVWQRRTHWEKLKQINSTKGPDGFVDRGYADFEHMHRSWPHKGSSSFLCLFGRLDLNKVDR